MGVPRAVLLVSPEEGSASLTHALRQSEWTLLTAADINEIPERVAKQPVLAILAPRQKCADVNAIAKRMGLNAKIVATVPFGDPMEAEAATEAGAFSVLRRPFASHEVLQVLGFAWCAFVAQAAKAALPHIR